MSRHFSMIAMTMLMMGSASMSSADGVDALAWLSGCWSLDGSERGSIEAWLAPAGGTLLGVSRTVKGGKTVAYEFMQIRAREDGTLAYIAKPSNQSEATFPLLRSSDQEVVFENLQHDFPQRISYRIESKGVLHARIEGTRNGKIRAIDYPMKRTSCEQQS